MSTAKAKVIASSIYKKQTITTFEIEFPRIILAEFNTHRAVSKNTSSSRAIPSAAVIEQLENNMFVPQYWGKNQSGMQAKEVLSPEDAEKAKEIWIDAGNYMIEATRKLQELNVHKQLANRLSEAFQYVRMVATATDWNNFFWLRQDQDAQPEMQDLANAMAAAMGDAFDRATPELLLPGEWHMPYYQNGKWTPDSPHSLKDALKISTSCCAQLSYRKNDDSLEKAERLFEMFFSASRIHASPAEHQATPILTPDDEGMTGITIDGMPKSNNFSGWIQHRSLIPNNVVKG